ncbi:MAG: aspartate aminotransferase family protein [Pseudomonadota bacterium]|uniref:aspartate aminotransferase family protein n=1 Tax=unclassified Phenylobacterium TaxID=2640670 RepID=UPI0006FBF2EE|nr:MULTISPECIES: aspartate aminotransferase family protein [unclassified Phenylobacterium]KRB49474.1 omega amino acid--pyruvate aminotransferase [Phenylobacterium sp. Root700]
MTIPNDLEAYWLPFTANRAFKAAPKMLMSADGMYYQTNDGRQILDAVSGLWCSNAGHNRRKIVEAIQKQAANLDFAPQFQLAHSMAFELSSRLVAMAPAGFSQVFYCNSGSEAADSALKIALAYHRARGEAGRTRLIGRERGYHGVGFGGISVGGIPANRRTFGTLLPGVDHLRHTLDIERNGFSRGLPEHGVELADDLERLVALHDASTIAAVIVEPVAGSTGVLPPPAGYLQRLRKICDQHGILLIFDEVITGFGRLGTPFGADWFGVTPDMITIAKGVTNGAVPMGGVITREGIFDAIADASNGGIELFHGYTYSGHPLACAAAMATLDVYEEEGLFQRCADISPHFEDQVHSLRGVAHVTDIRNLGLMAAIELASRPGAPGARATEVFNRCFDKGVLVRVTGDVIALSPPFIVELAQIDHIVETLREAIGAVA